MRSKIFIETINKIYLFKSNWSEEDYLFHLQNEKKTYNTLYGPIKKLESNLDVLQKKIKMINDKIIFSDGFYSKMLKS